MINAQKNASIALKSAKRAYGAGDLASAQRLSRLLVASAPTLGEPWIILGYIELRQRRPKAAVEMADKAIALEPLNSFGHLLRCRALMACARPADAIKTAQQAVANPDCPPVALDGFGSVFLQLANYRLALDLFKRAVAASPDNTGFLYNLAIAERACGATDDAERAFDRIIAHDPTFYTAYFMRSDLRKQTKERNHIDEMEALISGGVCDVDGEIVLRFALGKEYEDIGDTAGAILHIQSGADLKRRHIHYDVGKDIAVIDRIIEVQERATMDDLVAQTAPSQFTQNEPIFIVGLPRSGTTLVERIVANHSSVVSAGELGILPLELDRAVGRTLLAERERLPGDWVESLQAIDWMALGLIYTRLVGELGLPVGRVIDKNPANFMLCGAIRLAFPKARIIALRRRPMDNCFALYKMLFNGAAYPFSYDLNDLAEYYAAFSRLMTHWRTTLPEELLLEVSYEDIVADLAGQSRRILSFLGLNWQEDVMRFHESGAPAATASAMQVRRPIYSSSIDSWRRYDQQLRPLRARLAELIPPEELGPE